MWRAVGFLRRVTGASANDVALRDAPHLRTEEKTPVMRSSVSDLWKVVYGLIYSAGEGRSHGSRLLWTDSTGFEGHYGFWPALGEELIVLVVFCVSVRGDHLLMMLCELNCSLGTQTKWRHPPMCKDTFNLLTCNMLSSLKFWLCWNIFEEIFCFLRFFLIYFSFLHDNMFLHLHK